ncbi:general stress protein 26 [Paenibacillus sp. OAS669]|nr:general stress protein 26 [Paenibacillus sp. OAS669]
MISILSFMYGQMLFKPEKALLNVCYELLRTDSVAVNFADKSQSIFCILDGLIHRVHDKEQRVFYYNSHSSYSWLCFVIY